MNYNRKPIKGIVLAGGTGSRLFPVTKGASKQLLPVYDKPMIYYPLSTLMLSGIRNILIITTPDEQSMFKRLLGDGSQFGIQLSYEIQQKPEGIAQALLIAKSYLSDSPFALILGDNVFYGQGLGQKLIDITQKLINDGGAISLAYQVKDPHRFGIIDFDEQENVINIEEKPSSPRSNWALTGLYFFDSNALTYAERLTPSSRGELEIVDVIHHYLSQNSLQVIKLGRGNAWLDTGTFESLHQASAFVQSIQQVQGLKVACLEEIGWRKRWLDKQSLIIQAKNYDKNEYGEYLLSIIN